MHLKINSVYISDAEKLLANI